jgi:hypothetical protein
MSLPVITETITNAAAGLTGWVRLISSPTATASIAYTTVAGVVVGAGQIDIKYDRGVLVTASGKPLTLNPNTGLSSDAIALPTGTVYEVTTFFPGLAPVVRFISVPDDATSHSIQSLLVASPTGFPPVVTGSGAVASVAGRTGAVVLASTDISGLGSAATQPSSAFDTAGAATSAQAAATAAAATDATAKVATETTNRTAADALLTPLTDGRLTNPRAPTAGSVVSASMAGWTVNAQTGTSYTILAGDAYKIVTLNNAAPVTLNVDLDANQAHPIGAETIITGIGAGLVTLVGINGTVIDNPTGASTTLARYMFARLIHKGANVWGLNKGSRPPDGTVMAINAAGQMSFAPVAAVPFGAQKITGLANGSAATDGAAFGQIPTSFPPATHASTHLPNGSDALAWTTINAKGLLSARPAAGATNTGLTYLATDVAGGTEYLSDGTTWTATGGGVTPSTPSVFWQMGATVTGSITTPSTLQSMIGGTQSFAKATANDTYRFTASGFINNQSGAGQTFIFQPVLGTLGVSYQLNLPSQATSASNRTWTLDLLWKPNATNHLLLYGSFLCGGVLGFPWTAITAANSFNLSGDAVTNLISAGYNFDWQISCPSATSVTWGTNIAIVERMPA